MRCSLKFIILVLIPVAAYPQDVQLRLPEGNSWGTQYSHLSPDMRHMISLSSTDVKIWDVNSGKVIHSLKNGYDENHKIKFHPNGKYFISTSEIGDESYYLRNSRVWDIEKGEMVAELDGHSAIFSTDGKKIYSIFRNSILTYCVDGPNIEKSGEFNYNRDYIQNASLNENQTKALVSSSNNAVSLWDMENREVIWVKDIADPVYAVTFISGEARCLLGTKRGEVIQLDSRTGAVVDSFSIRYEVHELIYLADMHQVLVRSGISMYLYDLKTKEMLHKWIGHALVYNPQTKFIALVNHISFKGYFLEIVDLKNDSLINQISVSDKASAIHFSSDGSYVLATIGSDKKIELWDTFSGQKQVVFSASEIVSISKSFYSRNGSYVMLQGSLSDESMFKNYLHLYEAQNLNLLKSLTQELEVHTLKNDSVLLATIDHSRLCEFNIFKEKEQQCYPGSIHSKLVAYSPDNGKLFISEERDSTGYLFDTASGHRIGMLAGHNGPILKVVFSADGSKLLTISRDKSLKVWDTAQGKLLYDLGWHAVDYTLGSVEASFIDGDSIILTNDEEHVRKFDAKSGKLIYKVRKGFYNSMDVTSDGNFLITTMHNDSVILVWDLAKNELYNVFNDSEDPILEAWYDPAGQHIVTVSNRNVKVRDARDFELLEVFNGYTLASRDFSINGEMVVSSLEDYEILIYNLRDQKRIIFTTEEEIYAVNISPDGKTILIVNGEEVVMVKAGSGKVTGTLSGHTDYINSVRYNSEGSMILTSSDDGTARLWDASKEQLIKVLEEHNGAIVSAVFSESDNKIITTTDSHLMELWDIQTARRQQVPGLKDQKIGSVVLTGDNLIALSYEDILVIDRRDGKILKELNWWAHLRPFSKLSQNGKYALLGDALRDSRTGIVVSDNLNFPSYTQTRDKMISDNRIIDFNTAKDIVQLVLLDNEEKMALLPSGYYASTPGASKELYYIDNNNSIITFSQMDVKYNRPDLVLKALGNIDSDLVSAYEKAYEKRIKKLGIDTTVFDSGFSFPTASIKNRENIRFRQSENSVELHITGYDSVSTLDRFNIWINESPVFGRNGLNLRPAEENFLDTTINVLLTQGDNRIEVAVTNNNGIESFKKPLHVTYEPSVPIEEKLYFIGIGIDHFKEKGFDLNYSVKDIKDLAAAFYKKLGKGVIIDTLFNTSVTREAVVGLKKRLQDATINDKVIIAYSGHGLLNKNFDYFLSTYNASFSDPEVNGLPYEELEHLLDEISPRRKLMLIDACHSGEVDKEAELQFAQLAAQNENLQIGTGRGTVVVSSSSGLNTRNAFELMQEIFVNVENDLGATIISAASGTQFAYEKGDLRNGVFTYSILRFMEEYDSFTVQELKKHVSEEVERITKGAQKPTSRVENANFDWKVW